MTARVGARWGWFCGALLLAACSNTAPQHGPGAEPSAHVVVRIDPASPAECPDGGSLVSSGLDDNGDGTLQDAEIVTRTVVCNPAPVQPPPVLVIRLAAEPPGAHCSAGGTAVQSGPDQNRNGRLDDDEVSHTDYVCGQALLTRIAAEPPGARCSIGGVAFLAGRDRNGDGVLEDAEVETTELECGDVVTRDVTIANDTDVAALADVRVITGDVVAGFSTDLTNVSLPKLEHVGGALRILDSTRVQQIALPRLQEVDGDFTLRDLFLPTVDFSQLRRVGRLELEEISITDLSGFPALTEVERDVLIEFNRSLVSADLPLVSVGGDITISFNDRLATLAWTLSGRVGDVEIDGNAQLAAIDLSVAPTAGALSQIGQITMFDDNELTRIAVSAGRAGALRINFNPLIATIAVDVATFDSDLTVFGVTVPFHLALTAAGAERIAIGGRLIVSSPLEAIDIVAPLTVGDLCVFDSTLLARFAPGSPLVARGGVRFSANPQLTEIAPITLLGSLQVINNAVLPRIAFLTLQDHEIGDVIITDNPNLADAPSLAGVTRVRGAVDVERNSALTALFGPALFRVEGPMFIDDNPSLVNLQYPQLEHVVSDFEVARNASLQIIDVPALTEVADELLILTNPQLHHIAFDSLIHADVFAVQNNPRLPACEVLALFPHVAGFGKSQFGNDNDASCSQ